MPPFGQPRLGSAASEWLPSLDMPQFFYVDILQSEADPERFYRDLRDRLRRRIAALTDETCSKRERSPCKPDDGAPSNCRAGLTQLALEVIR